MTKELTDCERLLVELKKRGSLGLHSHTIRAQGISGNPSQRIRELRVQGYLIASKRENKGKRPGVRYVLVRCGWEHGIAQNASPFWEGKVEGPKDIERGAASTSALTAGSTGPSLGARGNQASPALPGRPPAPAGALQLELLGRGVGTRRGPEGPLSGSFCHPAIW